MTIVAGHRGAPRLHPDNTMAGFVAAADVVPMVEVDVRRSADGRFVLSHDPELGGLVVALEPWERLASVDVGEGHPPALLDELLEGIPQLRLDVEIKNSPLEPGFEDDHRTALEVAPLLRPGDVMTSFHWPTMDAVAARHPDVNTGVLVDRRGSLPDAIAHGLRHGHRLVAPHHSLLTRQLVADAAAADLDVAAWTVNDAEQASVFASWGVSTIITDDIHGISAALEDR